MTRVIVLRNRRQTCANRMQFFCCHSVSLGLAFFQIVCVTWRVDFKWYAKFLLCVTFCQSSFNVLLLCAWHASVCYIKTWDRENQNEQEALGSWDKKNYMIQWLINKIQLLRLTWSGLFWSWWPERQVLFTECSLCVDIFKYSLINGRYL